MDTYNAAYSYHIGGWICLPVDDIGDFQVVNHGVEHGQYFQGEPLEDWDDIAIGAGEDYNEALNDAIMQLDGKQRWQHSPLWEIYDIRCQDPDVNERYTVSKEIYDDGEYVGDEDWCSEFSYYVTVRLRRKAPPPIDMNSHLRII